MRREPPTWGNLAKRAIALVRSEFSAWRRARSGGVEFVGRGGYAAAAVNRLTADWVFEPLKSADQIVKEGHRRLVERARDAVRNDPYAARFVSLVRHNVVGEGIQLQSEVKTAGDEFDAPINDEVERAWREWGAPETCDAGGRLSWCDMEGAVIEDWARDGEALVQLLPGFSNRFGFALRRLDADQLDVTYRRDPGPGINEIRMGVEIDRFDRPVAYWIWTEHPGEHGRTRERERIPAEQLIHLYNPERPGQTRGVPRLATVLFRMNMLTGFEEAHVVLARMASAKGGFFTVDPEKAGDAYSPDPNDPNPAPIEMEAEPGRATMLPPGVGFVEWDPTAPSDNYGEFVRAALRAIATGLRVSYSSMSGDLSDANYGSQRGGLLTEREEWKALQRWYATQFHRRVFMEWLKWALTTGALRIPPERILDVGAHSWNPRGWDWIDPLKDIQAAILAIGAGLDSRTRICAARGLSFEKNLANLDREQQLARQYNVVLSTNVKVSNGASNGTEAEADGAAADGESGGSRDRARVRVV